MKNFLDLLATNQTLTVSINGKIKTVGITDTLSFDADSQVTVDNIEVLPKYRYLAKDNVLTINKPFYQWYHIITGQGWLLMPY